MVRVKMACISSGPEMPIQGTSPTEIRTKVYECWECITACPTGIRSWVMSLAPQKMPPAAPKWMDKCGRFIETKFVV
jgi:Fe-S-cluster-containing hydrogenase component 2